MKGFITVTRGKKRQLINTWYIESIEEYQDKCIIMLKNGWSGFRIEESFDAVSKLIEEAKS